MMAIGTDYLELTRREQHMLAVLEKGAGGVYPFAFTLTWLAGQFYVGSEFTPDTSEHITRNHVRNNLTTLSLKLAAANVGGIARTSRVGRGNEGEYVLSRTRPWQISAVGRLMAA